MEHIKKEFFMTVRLKDFEHMPYGQGQEIKAALGDTISQRSDISGGICFSLCISWIELHRKHHKMGNGEKYRVESMVNRCMGLMCDTVPFFRAANSQALDYKMARNEGLDLRGQLNAVGKKFNIKFGPGESIKNLRDQDLAVNKTHTYTESIFFFNTQKGLAGHAICSYRSGGKFFGLGSHLYVFDPNFGEYRVPSGQIVDFYNALFTNAYGGIKNLKSLKTFRVENI